MKRELNQDDELLCKECGNETKIRYYKVTENEEGLICFNCAELIKIDDIKK